MRLRDLLKPSQRKTVVVAMAESEPVLECVALAQQQDCADFILVGDSARIAALARQAGVALQDIECIPAGDEQTACRVSAGIVQQGRAQVIMKGLAHTAAFVRALLDKQAGLVSDHSLLSQVSILDIPRYHKALLMTDPGINLNPDLQQKVKLLQNAIGVMAALGIDAPKVACIAPVETVSSKIPSTIEAQELSRMTGTFGQAVVEGPLPFDAALSREAAEIKGLKSAVAGDPDILLMPELSSANVAYKALTVLAGAAVAGIAAGLKVPVVLTSRSDSEETRLLSLQLALSL